MAKMVKFTFLTRDLVPYLTDRCSERTENAAALDARVNLTVAVDESKSETDWLSAEGRRA